jgi:hypothetical protein
MERRHVQYNLVSAGNGPICNTAGASDGISGQSSFCTSHFSLQRCQVQDTLAKPSQKWEVRHPKDLKLSLGSRANFWCILGISSFRCARESVELFRSFSNALVTGTEKSNFIPMNWVIYIAI